MATIQGVNVGWGVSTNFRLGTGFTTTGAKQKNSGVFKELMDAEGVTKTLINNNPTQMLDLDVYPSGTTLGTLPAKGDVVLVAGVSYMFMDGEQQQVNEDSYKITMSLQKWPSVSLT